MVSKTVITKKTKKDGETFHRLENYFRSLEENTLNEYHKKRGRE